MTVPAPGAPLSGGSASGFSTPEAVPSGGAPEPGSPAAGSPAAGSPAVGSPAPGSLDPAVPEVPAPPTGPGVTPPFPAPPVEGRTFRMWLGLGVAALAVLLCCGGGAAALVGLAVTGTEAVNEQAQAVVGDYFDAVRERRYGRAYQLLCDDARRRESPAEFQERVSDGPTIISYRVGDAVLTNEITVPVEVTYSGGRQERLRASLAQDTGTGEFKICDVE